MTSPKTSIKSIIITQAIAIVFFVIVPIGITLMVPFTDLEFRKSEANTIASIRRYVLVFIPWQNSEIQNVKSVEAEITAEKHYRDTAENRRKGKKGTSVSTGQLRITGEGTESIVQADPELAKRIAKEFEQFVVTQNNVPLKYSVYASWTLSYVLGGIATFFAAFYVFGAAASIVIYPFKKTS